MQDVPAPTGHRWVMILFILAALVRAGWVTVRYSGERAQVLEYPDEEAYCQAARSLSQGQGLRDEFAYRATYMPAYPAFLSIFVDRPQGFFWARLLQAVIGAWVAPAIYLLASRWLSLARLEGDFGGGMFQAACVLAGLATAVDPFLVFFSGLLLTETLFAAGLVTAWWLLVGMCRPNRRLGVAPAVLLGGVLLLCVMLRPSSAVLAPMAAAAVAVCRRMDRAGVVAGIISLVVVVLGLVPWAARNHAVIGQWRWLTTRGGISFYDGFQPGATGASDLAHTKVMPEVKGLGEVEWDRYFQRQAWSAIRQDPGRAIGLAWPKFRRTWNPWPNVENYRRGLAGIAAAVWTMLLLGLAACGLWRTRGAVAAWVVLLLPVAVFTFVHMIYVGSVRYRVPVMPLVMVLAGVGLAGLLGACRRGLRPRNA